MSHHYINFIAAAFILIFMNGCGGGGGSNGSDTDTNAAKSGFIIETDDSSKPYIYVAGNGDVYGYEVNPITGAPKSQYIPINK